MDKITDTDIELIRACADSLVLSNWLIALSKSPDDIRQLRIADLVKRMRADQEDSSLIAAIQRLSEKEFFTAFFQTWKEAE